MVSNIQVSLHLTQQMNPNQVTVSVVRKIVQTSMHIQQADTSMNIYKRIIIPLVISMALLLILYAKHQEPGRPNYYDSPVTEDTGERYG